MGLQFERVRPPLGVNVGDWTDWKWQQRHSLKSQQDYAKYFSLDHKEIQYFTSNEAKAIPRFRSQTTPYYAQLASRFPAEVSLRRIMVPTASEFDTQGQHLLDPLGERQHSPCARIIHRYPDRVLFLVTDQCAVYCRYCTRKHFTGQQKGRAVDTDFEAGLEYIKNHPGVREVILSGGDPLTLSDNILDEILKKIRQIKSVEIIRIGSRVPIANPFRLTEVLAKILKKHAPVFLMTHFNHPDEVTADASVGLGKIIDHGTPIMNQMVLLNGINNHPALIQALSRRLLYLRVKPYYMFQCDPSEGTEGFRTSVGDSMLLQRELWGRLSGLAMPTLSLDIPAGGGKVSLVPNFLVKKSPGKYTYKGWDGHTATYEDALNIEKPQVDEQYQQEWQTLKDGPYGQQ